MKEEDTKINNSSTGEKQEHEPDNLSLKEAQLLIRELQTRIARKDEELDDTRAQLEKAQIRYAEFYDFMPTACYKFNPNGLIMDVNRAAAEQLGVDRETLIRTHIEQYILPEDIKTFHSHLKNTFKTNALQTCELRFMRKDESQFPGYLKSICLHDDEGKLRHSQTTILDMTDRKKTEDSLLQREGELALLNRASQIFSSTHDLDEILATVLKEGRRLLEVVSSSVWLIDPDTNELVCKHAVGPNSAKVRGWRLSPGQGIAGAVADTGKSLLISDTWSDERHFKGVDKKTGQPLRSILCVPLKVKQKVIGILQVLDTETNKFSVTDQAMEELLAAEASIALENSQLYDQLRQNAQTEVILLYQLNHRVKNNLKTIKDLFSFVKRHAGLRKRPFLQDLVADLLRRVESLETAHGMVTEFDWNPLPLSGLSIRVIESSLEAAAPTKEVTIEVSPAPVQISPKQANSLALIIHELVMNTIEYAIGNRKTGRITVYINRMGDTVQFEFRDDGPGYPNDILRFDHHNVGLYLIQKITHKDLHGELVIHNDDGAVTIIRFNPQENSKTK